MRRIDEPNDHYQIHAMETSAPARISVHSRCQAMDWSLVLISQGIESTIEYAEDGAGWGLLVAGPDYENAMMAIRQYRLENRAWPWQQEMFRQSVLFDWVSLAWALLLAVFFWLQNRFGLQTTGLMDSSAVAHGQWWRWFTAIWLHADLAHFAANATIGFVLLGLAMGRYGTGAGLLAAYMAGAVGNIAAGVLSSGVHHSLGASGMVMGCLGLLAAQTFSLSWRTPGTARYVLRSMGAGLMLFVLLALTPGTDIVAHTGGFIAGILIGTVLKLSGHFVQRPRINLLGGVLFALLVIIPWWLALKPAHP